MKLLQRSNRSKITTGSKVGGDNDEAMPDKRQDRFHFALNWSSPSSSVEERDVISTQRTKHRAMEVAGTTSGPLDASIVTPCRLPNASAKMATTSSASSTTTAITAAITPMTPSPIKSPPNLKDHNSMDRQQSRPLDPVSTQPGTAPTTAPGPRGPFSPPHQSVTFRQMQQGFQHDSWASNEHRYITPSLESEAIPLDDRRRTLFASDRLSPTIVSRKRRSSQSLLSSGVSSRRSRLQESLLLIDDPPMRDSRRRSSSAHHASFNSFPNYSFEISSNSSPDASPNSLSSFDAATGRTASSSSSSSATSPHRLRRRSSQLLSLPDDAGDCCFEDSNKKGTGSKGFSKRGSVVVLYTLCLAAVMTSLGMIVYTKFVPFQQGGSFVSSQQLELYYPPTRPHQRPDVQRSASGLRGKMVQSGASRLMTTSDQKNSDGSTTTKSSKHQTTSKPDKKHQKDKPSSSASASKHKKESSTNKKKDPDSHHEKKDKKSSTNSPTKKQSSHSHKASPPREAKLTFHMPDKPLGAPSSGSPWEVVSPSFYILPGVSSPQKTKKQLQSQPRVFALDDPFGDDKLQEERVVQQYPSDFTDHTQLYSILDSDDERLSKMEIREPYSDGECVPMQEWQTTFHPSCNGMHELSIENSVGSDSHYDGDDVQLFGTKGYWRNAWRLDLLQRSSRHEVRDTVVLKTLKFEHNYEDDFFEHNRVDAVAMERLTSSQHVINLFGFCGHSVLTEFADGSRVGELADKARKRPLARLKIASDIAHGLADVHGIDGDGNATFVHLDVNPANVVSIGGTLKLNDFNIGIIRRWNTTSNEPCGFPAQYPNPQWRSPEEARNEQHLTEKVDIFSMGHIFFRLIGGHEPWNKLEPGGKPPKDVMNEKVKQGKLPFIPEHVLTSEDPEVIAIREAMMKCYTYDPQERPSARSIAVELDSKLAELEIMSGTDASLESR